MAFAELACATHYSFLRGASSPAAMVERALALGHGAVGIADRNSVAGVVRAHVAVREAEGLPAGFRLVVGARLVFEDATPDVLAYPATRRGWGRLCRLLTLGNLRVAKGGCALRLEDLLGHIDDMLLVGMPGKAMPAPLAEAGRGRLWLAAVMPRGGADRRRLAARMAEAARLRLPLMASNDALYAEPGARALQDVLSCIREGTTLDAAGRRLEANAERHLKAEAEMQRLFADCPDAVEAPMQLVRRVAFDLDQLRYEYPNEPVPPGHSAQGWLETLTMQKARVRWPQGVPAGVMAQLQEEFRVIGKAGYAPYFLTVHDMVAFAQAKGILCQGRGSAANSAVCFVLGITAVDPSKHNLLFSRFISEERREPPDIDVDFEHERREEVIQYIYARYGRERAGIAATVAHYRPRSAVREVGKVLGLTEDMTGRLSGTVWGSFSRAMEEKRFAESGLDIDAPEIRRLIRMTGEIMGLPRHLGQHVGGFVLTQDRLDETVPIHNAAMPDRTFIEWDKDDIDALGLMKVDVLALGMLSCIRRAFALIKAHIGRQYTLDNVPDEAPDVFDMLCLGDSVGVFQVESRAQMNMLPRLRPREFYDLVIQVAIVRPGPIQGDMVHPYLRRRQGREAVSFPAPAAPHDRDELKGVLGRTLGVPLFQEQAMRLAIVAAAFTPSEANQLRRAMATFRNIGTMGGFAEKMIEGMVARGYERDFATRCFKQIEGFGSYGFPESHALAFARLVWISSYLKCRYPAVFAAALLNSQPMGFYAPAQIVRDAREHGVAVLPVDVNASDWDCTLEAGALRLGLRQVTGFRAEWAAAMAAARPFASLEDMARRAALPPRALKLLADADAVALLGLSRREGGWDALRTPADVLPLFAAAGVAELGEEPAFALPEMRLGEDVAADYQVLRLSLKAHPMALLRGALPPGTASAAEVSAARAGRQLSMAGVVLVRQRPGNGNAIFITLEDETGVVNVVLWARLFEHYRRAVMGARLMCVRGEVQRSPEGVVHLMGVEVLDWSGLLDRLSDAHALPAMTARGDENLADPPTPRGRHPRDVRILPRSRDFH
ncbi:error-prone DNA polymerase [Polymorphobacter multimanifer]|uniref:Error-prone DNA polymerase n=1 Tax=Polymorphobacter multimanifer TaxID=1070431 RepID=A0A841L9B2_9SPHN|nr:error-prone DNA polymerase [Polymorphobacter multimanifer]MBB6228756.1 error-prone DNA polymerase [Polymorphobacter multimanifer]